MYTPKNHPPTIYQNPQLQTRFCSCVICYFLFLFLERLLIILSYHILSRYLKNHWQILPFPIFYQHLYWYSSKIGVKYDSFDTFSVQSILYLTSVGNRRSNSCPFHSPSTEPIYSKSKFSSNMHNQPLTWHIYYDTAIMLTSYNTSS